jgi:hypothetical protein
MVVFLLIKGHKQWNYDQQPNIWSDAANIIFFFYV